MGFIHIKPEKKFQCTTCPTKCHTRGQFERHLEIHQGKFFECPRSGCESKRKTQYDLNHHIRKKHGKVNHKKDYIPIEERPLIECDKCDQKLKPGASPMYTLKLHMKTHVEETCIFPDCKFVRYDKDPKYYHTKEMYSHILEVHDLARSNWQVSYKCKICNAQVSSSANTSLHAQRLLKDSLVAHMFTHEEARIGIKDSTTSGRNKRDKFSRDWSQFYERQGNILDKACQDHAASLSI